MDNLPSGSDGDNHIKRFGFLTNSMTVDIYDGIEAPSAPWPDEVRYVALA